MVVIPVGIDRMYVKIDFGERVILLTWEEAKTFAADLHNASIIAKKNEKKYREEQKIKDMEVTKDRGEEYIGGSP